LRHERRAAEDAWKTGEFAGWRVGVVRLAVRRHVVCTGAAQLGQGQSADVGGDGVDEIEMSRR
jgi:hypothetical protein